MYYSEAMVYGNAVADELVRVGACANRQHCAAREMVLWEGGGWQIGPFRGGGVSIEVYRIDDPAVAKMLVDRCQAIHAASPSVPVSIVVYSNAHIDNRRPGRLVVVREARFS
jgi:hypothetical protein